MRRSGIHWVACAGIAAMSAGCSVTALSRTELAEVVERDGVAFDAEEIPESVIRRLADNRLIVVGETHYLQEHDDFMITLVDSLYEHGFRQILLEAPHMVDWLVDELVAGSERLDWDPPGWFYYDIIMAVRDFNTTVPPTERIHMRAIDANLDEYGGAKDFRGIMGRLRDYLPTPGPLAAFLAGPYGTPEVQRERLALLQSALTSEEASLRSVWGDDWYERVGEMVEVEETSVGIREIRKDDYDRSVRRREREMKRLADLRLRGAPFRSIVNVGSTHAQKERLMGTDIEWLGDYLVHESTAVGGASMVLCVGAAEIISSAGSGYPDWSIMAVSPDNELWRLMNETWPGQTVFLPLDDPVFSGGVAMNFEDVIHKGAPKRHYDAFLLLPVAHRIPS